jgi:hypothetical protein
MKLALLALLVATGAFAQSDDLINPDRPGIADGSATIGRGRFQIETGAERDDASDSRTLTTPTLVRYGVSEALELRVEGEGWQHELGDGSSWQPASIGLKYHFFDKPSLGVIARVFPTEHEGDVRLAADIDLNEHWSLNPNVGVDRHSATAALTVQYNLSKRLNVFVDGGAERSSLLLDTGVAWIIGRDTQLDASVGWGAHGADNPNVFFSAGISRRF